jgi:hypothetical protein
MDDDTTDVETTPEWDPDYYAERVGRFVDMNTDFEKQTVARAEIAQLVKDELDTDYLNETINVALAQDLIVETAENRYAPVE